MAIVALVVRKISVGILVSLTVRVYSGDYTHMPLSEWSS